MNFFGNQSKSYLAAILKSWVNSPKAYSYEKITVDGSVKQLTVPADAIFAELMLESDLLSPTVATRYMFKGDPSSTDGMGLINLDKISVSEKENLINFKITQAAAGTHTLHVTYYK